MALLGQQLPEGDQYSQDYSYILPTVINNISANILIRLTMYRTSSGSGSSAVLQGSSFNSAAVGGSYSAQSFTLSLTKL